MEGIRVPLIYDNDIGLNFSVIVKSSINAKQYNGYLKRAETASREPPPSLLHSFVRIPKAGDHPEMCSRVQGSRMYTEHSYFKGSRMCRDSW